MVRILSKRPTQLALAIVTILSVSLALFQPAPAPRKSSDLPAIPAMNTGTGADDTYASVETQAIEGWVTDKGTGAYIPGAIVSLAPGIQTNADQRGYFAFSAAQTEQGSILLTDDSRSVKLTVSADGYAQWTISKATYYAHDTLRLYPSLSRSVGSPIEIVAARHDHQKNLIRHSPVSSSEPLFAALTTGQSSMAGQSAPGAPPASVRVYRTQDGTVEVVPFRDYVKHVLPVEWLPTWHANALKAGAMAAKTYAWYWISRGGKQVALGADVKDNEEDQVYDPNISYASTDAAVDATFDYVMTINGALFQSQYCAGTYAAYPGSDCPWQGPFMTQWGSAYHADGGRSWGWILQFYYAGAFITPNPPGGGYDGMPPPTSAPRPTTVSQPTPIPQNKDGYAIGQGSTQPQVFQEAYDRNGGSAKLGSPAAPVRWWLPYVTEHNVVAQRFNGPDGRGNVWLVFDVLKGVNKAYLLAGNIGSEYATHTPPGPEWVGAPTSDPYIGEGARTAQTFARGTLVDTGNGVQVATSGQPLPATASPAPASTQAPTPEPPPTGQASLQVRVQWLGRKQAPSDSWVQPLTLQLSVPGNPKVIGTYRGATDRNGVALYQNLPTGTFDVHVKGAHSLQSSKAAISLTNGMTAALDMKTQVEGDVDGDNCVTVDDFSEMQSLLGTNKNTPGFNERNDLNGDGVVTMSDISLLRSGFERCGDISADPELQALSTNSSPSLAEALAPWTNPGGLQHNLSLDLAASAQNVKVGSTVKIDVIAQAGGQPIDGASFLLHYDPQKFLPLDAAGNTAAGLEPGYTLPSVMGNWIDRKNGSMGFSSGVLQGAARDGRIVLAQIRFRALPSVGTGPALFYFSPAPSPHMQLTNGGENLLTKTNDLTISVED